MSQPLWTYSFLDTQAAISGPGGAFSLGAGAGASDEGITIQPNGEIDELTIGADGFAMHALVADKSGKISVSLLKTSPTNLLLSTMVAFQRTSGANFGQNVITIMNSASGDIISASQVAFAKIPEVKYGKQAGTITWEFNAGVISIQLGNGF